MFRVWGLGFRVFKITLRLGLRVYRGSSKAAELEMREPPNPPAHTRIQELPLRQKEG